MTVAVIKIGNCIAMHGSVASVASVASLDSVALVLSMQAANLIGVR